MLIDKSLQLIFICFSSPSYSSKETTAPQTNINKRFVLEIGGFKNCTLLIYYWLIILLGNKRPLDIVMAS